MPARCCERSKDHRTEKNSISKEHKNQSGLIWKILPAERERIARRVCETLEEKHGRPRFSNPDDPLDDLIYVIVSNRTSPMAARRVYASLKDRFTIWNEVLDSSVVELAQMLQPAGLAAVKSQQIWTALEKIRQDFGSCNFHRLEGRSTREAQDYLISLPRVSLKVAKCVMLYTVDAQVLPVDGHVHRVTRDLGWNDRKRADQCHEELETLVPLELRHELHIDCIAHGRSICRPEKPAYERCCAYFNDAA